MAQLYTVGPSAIYLAVPAGNSSSAGSIFFLGHCEEAPRVQLRPASEAVYNALSGTKVPHDKSQQLEEAFISLDLTRYNQRVVDMARQRSKLSTAPGGVPGVWGPLDVGTLMITENAAFVLWMTFPYAIHPAMAAGGQRPGYRFAAVDPAGPDDLGPLGTRARRENLMFHAIPRFTVANGVHTLYDFNTSGLPAID